MCCLPTDVIIHTSSVFFSSFFFLFLFLFLNGGAKYVGSFSPGSVFAYPPVKQMESADGFCFVLFSLFCVDFLLIFF